MRVRLARGASAKGAIANTSKLVGSCVRCGMCITSCPSYLVTLDERHSPRGRIYLIKQILEQNSKENSNSDFGLSEYFETCLTCLSCETACPSNVVYSEIIEYARSLSKSDKSKTISNYIKSLKLRLMINFIITGKLFAKVVGALHIISPVIKPILFGKLADYFNLLPKISPTKFTRQSKLTKVESKLILFSGCVEKAIYAKIANSITNVMNKLNIEVIYLKQSCCGALHYHNGLLQQAQRQQQKFKKLLREALEQNNITNCNIVYTVSGCGKQLLDSNLNSLDQADVTKANQQIYNLSIFECGEWLYKNIVELKKIIKPNKLKALAKKRIVFHPPCSLQHSIKKFEETKKLLDELGLNYSLPENYDICCGSAGIYNFNQIDISEKLKTKKIISISNCKPDIVISSNLGCLLQIKDNKNNLATIEYLHIAELIEKLL